MYCRLWTLVCHPTWVLCSYVKNTAGSPTYVGLFPDQHRLSEKMLIYGFQSPVLESVNDVTICSVAHSVDTARYRCSG